MKFLGYTLFERIEENKTPEAKIVKTQFTKEQPDKVSFERLILYHDQTPQIRTAVSAYSELITGTEMVITADDEAAKKEIDEWIRTTNFYNKFEGVVTTTLICGNALLERLDPNDTEDVQEVDMSTIVAKKRTAEGKLEWYEQRQQAGGIVKLGEHNTDRFIEFNLTNFSQQAWGRSLFYPLAVARATGHRITAPLVEIMWGVEDAMAGIIQNNAYPITTITYDGGNDEFLKKETEFWRRYKPGDKRVGKITPRIEFFETSPASKYTDYVEHLEKTFELGTQFPHDIMTGDFTSRASSETTETIVMKLVRGFQQYMCTKLKKELFEPILEQKGFDAEKANLTISFTAQNVVELMPEQVLKLFTDKAITIDELREWYRDNTGIDLPDDAGIKQMMDEEKQREQDEFDMQAKAMDNKVNDLKSKVEQFVQSKDHDDKMVKMSADMADKITKIREAIDANNQGIANRKIKALEKFIERAEKIG
jgi:hypothetical protein